MHPTDYTAAARELRVQRPQITGKSHSWLLLRRDSTSESWKRQLQSLDVLGNFRRGVAISKSTIYGLLWKSPLIL